jgi:hypothetical protein
MTNVIAEACVGNRHSLRRIGTATMLNLLPPRV